MMNRRDLVKLVLSSSLLSFKFNELVPHTTRNLCDLYMTDEMMKDIRDWTPYSLIEMHRKQLISKKV